MSSQVAVDRGYLNLLSHLRTKESPLSPETIHAAICHYLVHPPPTLSTPSPLVESIFASPRWASLSLTSALEIGNAFRTATLLRWQELKKKERGFFDASLSTEFGSWIHSILSTSKDGRAMLRIATLGGLLSGLKALESGTIKVKVSTRGVEEGLVLAFAEVMNAIYDSMNDPWASEFESTSAINDNVDLAILLAAHFFDNIPDSALSALKLTSLASLCLSTIERAFMSGSFLQSAPRQGRMQDRSHTAHNQINLEKDISTITQSDTYIHIALICKLLARVVDLLSHETHGRKSTKEVWDVCSSIVLLEYKLFKQVEKDWCSSYLVNVESEEQIDGNSGNTKLIWTILKTQLFAALMLYQATLVCLLYASAPLSDSSLSAPVLAGDVLRTLLCFSFVLSEFGGVSSNTGSNNGGPSFPELKRVFYMAIDLLSSDKKECEVFIKDLIAISNEQGSSGEKYRHEFITSRRVFILCCVEQLIPVFEDEIIENDILPLCEPHLNNAIDREAFESAHSVMLAIFAAAAEKAPIMNIDTIGQQRDSKGKKPNRGSDIDLATRLVPGYVQLLLENAKEGGLTTPQLRLAYAAIVRSTSSGRRLGTTSSTSTSPLFVHRIIMGSSRDDITGDPALTWLCVEHLIQSISQTPYGPTNDNSKYSNSDPKNTRDSTSGIYLAKCLTLVSLLPNVGPSLLPRFLEELEHLIDSQSDVYQKRILIENTFEELLERIADAEREIAMQWWFRCSRKWNTSTGRDEEEASTPGSLM